MASIVGADIEMPAQAQPVDLVSDTGSQMRAAFLSRTRSQESRALHAKAKFLSASNVNPFGQRTIGLFSSPMRSIKTIVLIPIVTVRVLLVLICLIITALLTVVAVKLAGLTIPEIGGKQFVALPWYSRMFLCPVPLIIRSGLFFFGFHWVTWEGKPALKSEAPIITPSHSSWVDSFYLTSVLWCCAMAEANTFKQPVVGSVSQALQFVSVERENHDSRKLAVEAMTARCNNPECPVFMIFPEGVCTSGTHLVQFKDGAFRMGFPVQPVGIFYPRERWCSGYDPKNPMDPKAVVPHVIRALFEFHNPMHIVWCDPYIPSEEEKKDSRLYASNVRNYLAQKTGKLLTNHAFEDVRLAMLAKREHKIEKTDWVMVEQGKVYDTLHFNFGDTKAILERFINVDTAKTGQVNIEQFLSALNLPRTPLTLELFKLYDLNGDGSIDFREYMCAQAILRGISNETKREDEHLTIGSPLHEESLDFAWWILTGGDRDKTMINISDFKQLLDRYSIPVGSQTHMFDMGEGSKATMDRKAFDAAMRLKPEYMQLIRLGEQERSGL